MTGGTGFVGQGLVQALAKAGRPGVVSTRALPAKGAVGVAAAAESLPENWQWMRRGTIFQEGVGPVDAVFHLEVKQHVFQPTAADLAEFPAVNVSGTQAWLDWCTVHGVKRFIHFSTIKAVEAEKGPGPVDERSRERPGDTPYGRSKWEAEERVQAWAAADPTRSALILRPAVVYGPGNSGNIAAMVDAVARGRFCFIGKNANVKSLVSRTNLVAAALHLVARMRPGCEVFYVTDKETVTVRALVDLVRARLGGRRVPTLPRAVAGGLAVFGEVFGRVTGRTFPINRSRLEALTEETWFSCEKLQQTGFRHPQSLEAGIQEMIEAR